MVESDELAFNFTRNDVGQYRCISANKLATIEKVIRIGYYGRLLLIERTLLGSKKFLGVW